MKKIMILAAAAALALVACAKVETIGNTHEENAVSFGVYAGKSTDTKATYGDLTTANIKSSEDGFGVFAYYTLHNEWASTDTPNFMYNQKVYFDGDANETLYPEGWVYSPLKYWPNGQNSTTVESGTINDKLSFYAYAPHIATVNTVPTAGQGITAMSANNAAGAPTISFTVPAKAEQQIDLLWAIPVLNQTKQELDGTVNFTFKHALAKLNVKVQAVVDAAIPTTANLDAATSIILTSLKIEADHTKSGVLTLDSDDADVPNWGSVSGKTEVTYDASSFATTTVNGKTGFNVTETATDLNATNTPMIIPGTIDFSEDQFLVITADYWVLTNDTALDGNYSSVRQVIKKTSTADVTFAAGKKYDILVKLGLNSVDFDVTEVTNWGDGTPDPAVDLPVNIE